jgi:hypothetical protein
MTGGHSKRIRRKHVVEHSKVDAFVSVQHTSTHVW